VIGIEENTALRVEDGRATVRGAGRVKLFRRDQPQCWFTPAQEVPHDRIPLLDGEKQQKPLIPALRRRNTTL
jgi:hypothetical protein